MKKLLLIYKDQIKHPGKLTRKLMLILIIKLFIMFTVIRIFFPDIMKKNFKNDAERSDFIIKEMTVKNQK